MVATQAAGCHRAAPISFASQPAADIASSDSLCPPIASSDFRLRWAGAAVGLPQHKQAHADLRRWEIAPMLPQLPATALPPPPPPSHFGDAAALVCRLSRRHQRISEPSRNALQQQVIIMAAQGQPAGGTLVSGVTAALRRLGQRVTGGGQNKQAHTLKCQLSHAGGCANQLHWSR